MKKNSINVFAHAYSDHVILIFVLLFVSFIVILIMLCQLLVTVGMELLLHSIQLKLIVYSLFCVVVKHGIWNCTRMLRRRVECYMEYVLCLFPANIFRATLCIVPPMPLCGSLPAVHPSVTSVCCIKMTKHRLFSNFFYRPVDSPF